VSPGGAHVTVLLEEAVDSLAIKNDGVYVDATFGRGGHSRRILSCLGENGRLVAVDRDPQAILAGEAIADSRFRLVHRAFGELSEAAAEAGVSAVDGILFDVGVSSPQIDDGERGFSFRHDAPLDMRMDTTRGETAADFLARADERDIARVIKDHGEERFAQLIARALVARREGGGAVRTTAELSQLVARAVKTREPGQDPATRTFQALRIFVNAELEALEQGLNAALELLAPAGRLVVISFHSLEDRIVKNFIARESRDVPDRRALFAPPKPLKLHAVARVKPSDDEVRANPRARSAVMRVAERTEVPADPATSRLESGRPPRGAGAAGAQGAR